MSEFKLTPNAYLSLKKIGLYTQENWGREQRDKYLRDLDKRFLWLAQRPNLGRRRNDIAEGYFCFPQGSHLIFYILSDSGIEIIDIVHQDADIMNYFDAD